MDKKKRVISGVLSLALALSVSTISSGNTAAAKTVKTKAYTLSKKAGTYKKTIKVKLKVKKGYKVYYSTNGKFSKKRVVKAKKSKTFTIKKTKTLYFYGVKKTKKVTAEFLKRKAKKMSKKYKYTIKKEAVKPTATPAIKLTTPTPTPATVSEDKGVVAQSASGRGEEYVKELNGTWQFIKFPMNDKDALGADFSKWDKVTLPHTWNSTDGEDGGTYSRGKYWYEKDFSVSRQMKQKKIYIEFLGANTVTTVYVNGKQAGEPHKGGYTAFRYDITDKVKEGKNSLVVSVNNLTDSETAPLSGDFNMYGGLYRRVYLITVDDVHVDLNNNGSSGLFLETGNVRSKERPENLGEFKAKTTLVNDSSTEKTVKVVTTITGDNAPKPYEDTVKIPAGKSVDYEKDCAVTSPTLWEGETYEKDSPSNVGYQYKVSVEIKDESKTLDKIEEKIGFRYFWIDSSEDGDSGEGFYLNGKKFPLRGVNRHSCLKGVGSAMTEEQHKADMDIIKELGVNALRLCHYPHTDAFYDLCDGNGIIVWTEIPVVNEVRATDGFVKVTKQQLTELISQQYNRPSVVFWGLENEIGQGQPLNNATANANLSSAKKLIYELDALAKELDTTGRYTTQALNRDYGMDQNKPESTSTDFDTNIGWKSDLIAWNIYPKWYADSNFSGSFADVVKRKMALDSRSFGLSEYGWGANPNQHVENPVWNSAIAGSQNHPEEFQSMMNEEALEYINQHDELWGTFYWVMFDFAVDSRNEGGQIAQNDKGLVTADRKIKKDSYYLYKANWNKRDIFTYIASRRWTEREDAATKVKVYSNCDKVELFVNGKSLGEMTGKGNGVFQTDDITLELGDNVIKTVGICEGDTKKYEDTCTWTLKEPDTDNLAYKKNAYASSEEDNNGNIAKNAVDGNLDTKWVAHIKDDNDNDDAKYPEWLCVDLGAECTINSVKTKFESKNGQRYYGYNIYVSNTAPENGESMTEIVGKGFTKVVSKEDNTVSTSGTSFIDNAVDNKKGRYVLVEITSCNQWKAADAQRFQAACLYELEVYGSK